MKKTRMILSLLLVLVMVFSMAACGTPSAESSATTDSSKSEESTTEESKAEETATTAETFKVATVRWTDSWPVDFLKTGVMADLEKKHNINIDWQVFYNSDWAEQKSLLLASGDLPDAFFGSISLKDTDIAQNESYFVELTDLISANMPNLTTIFGEDKTMKAMVMNRENKIFSLPKKLPLRPQVDDVMFINQKWLDALNLKMPTTYQELETVLEAFVKNDPNGNGKNDEFGYTAALDLGGALRWMLSPFGTMVSREGNYMGLVNDKPVFMPVEKNYYDSVIWMNNLYKKGLLDPEIFTQDSSMVDAKTKDPNGSLSGIGFGWTADAVFSTNNKDYVVVPALAGPDGKRYAEHSPEYLDQSRNELVITTKCANPAKLLQWADDFYTDETSLQTYYGSIADGKIKADGGKYEVLVPEDGSSLDTSAWSYSFRDFGPKYMSKEFEANVVLPKDQGDGVKLADDSINAEYITSTFPVVSYTTDQTMEVANLSTDIYSYVKSQFAHWVVDGGIETEWDAYLAQLDAMGLQRLLEIQTEAYNAYTANLK